MLIYPELIPNFIQYIPIDWKGYREEFATSDILRYPQQWYNTNVQFNFNYKNLCRTDLETIIQFHKDLALETNRVFIIPSIVFRNFQENFKQRIFCNQDYWIFDENVLKSTPRIVNSYAQTYDLDFKIRSVIA